MNVRLTFLLVVVLMVVGGAVWIIQSGRTSQPERLQPWLWKVGFDDISHVAVTHQGDSISYDLQGEQWVIEDGNDTPVYLPKWSGITLTLSGPRPARILSQTVEEPARYGLDPPRTVVQVTDRSGRTVQFDLGNPTPDLQNQYIRLDSGSLSTIALVWGEVMAKLVIEPPYSPPFLSALEMEEIQGLIVTSQGRRVSYGLDDKSWFIFEGDEDSPVDPTGWTQISRSFNGQVMVVSGQPLGGPAEYGLDSPSTVLEIFPRVGDEVRFYIGDVTEDGTGSYILRVDSGQLATVDRDWAEVVAGLAIEPPYPAASDTAATGG